MNRKRGFTLVEILIVISIIGILAIIAIPNWKNTRYKAFDASAVSAGKQFQITQGIYNSQNNTYATTLEQLLEIDKNLIDDPGVTFLWIESSTSGYTVNVKHIAGKRWTTYTD